jgi:hypothetical protein
MNYVTEINNIKLQINIVNIILIIIIKRSNKYSFMNISYRNSQVTGGNKLNDPVRFFFFVL